MPLSQQELNCVELACAYLAEAVGGSWHLIGGQPSLDEQNPNEPSPETLVTNDVRTAGVDVKRVTSDDYFNEFVRSITSLNRRLIPSCGGLYRLDLPHPLCPPLSQPLMRHLKQEIERVAPTLVVGDRGAVIGPRRGVLRLIGRGKGHIHCCHRPTGQSTVTLGPVHLTAPVDWLRFGFDPNCLSRL